MIEKIKINKYRNISETKYALSHDIFFQTIHEWEQAMNLMNENEISYDELSNDR